MVATSTPSVSVPSRGKVIAVVLAVAVPAFLAFPVLFAPPATTPELTAGQLPLFIVLSAFDSLVLGAGVAFALFGWPLARRVAGASRRRAMIAYAAVTYLLLSWWLHMGLHISTGSDLAGILLINYVFHIPLMVSAALLAWVVVSFWREGVTTVSRDPE